MQPNLIIDQAAVLEIDRCWREDSEIQPRRGDLLELEGIAKEIKYMLAGLRQHDGTSEFVTTVIWIPVDLNHVASLSNL